MIAIGISLSASRVPCSSPDKYPLGEQGNDEVLRSEWLLMPLLIDSKAMARRCRMIPKSTSQKAQ